MIDEPIGRRRRPDAGDRSSNRLRPQRLQRQRLDAALEEVGPTPPDAPDGFRQVRILLALMRGVNPAVRRELVGQLFELVGDWSSSDFERAAQLIRHETEGK